MIMQMQFSEVSMNISRLSLTQVTWTNSQHTKLRIHYLALNNDGAIKHTRELASIISVEQLQELCDYFYNCMTML